MTTPTMVVLRPGDKVLVTLVDEPTPQDIQDVAGKLRSTFPGVDFTILSGVSGIAVAAPE